MYKCSDVVRIHTIASQQGTFSKNVLRNYRTFVLAYNEHNPNNSLPVPKSASSRVSLRTRIAYAHWIWWHEGMSGSMWWGGDHND